MPSNIASPRYTPAVRLPQTAPEAPPQEGCSTAAAPTDALNAALPPRGSGPAGLRAPRAGLPVNHLQRALETAVAEGDVQSVRQLLVAGADPYALAPRDAPDDRSDVRTLLSAARLMRRLLPANLREGAPETPLLQALRGFDLPLARQLYTEESDDRSVTAAWHHAVVASRTDLLIAILVLHAGESIEAQLGAVPRDDSLNGELHLPLRFTGAPGLAVHLKQFPYYSEKPGRRSSANLNCEAFFPAQQGQAKTQIICRHLAMAWLMQHDSPAGKPDYQALGTIDAIARHVPRSIDALYMSLLNRADEVHVVRHSDWGQFTVERFQALERSGASTARIFIQSQNHALAAEFRIKHTDSQAPQYVLNVYDPNVTAAHKRLSSDDLARFEEGRLQDFLKDDKWLHTYFKEADTALVAVGIPAGGMAKLSELPPAGLVDRRVSSVLPPLDTSVIHQLMHLGLGGTLRDLKVDLLRLAERSPQEAFELLNTTREGWSGLAGAVAYEQTDSIAAFCEIVISSPLNQEQKATLLGGLDGKENPALYNSMVESRSVAVCRMLIDAMVQSGLDAETRAKLLAAHGKSAIPAQSEAMVKGRAPFVQAFVEGVVGSDLPLEVQRDLLHARRADGTPALYLTMMENQPRVVYAFVRSVLASPLPGAIKLEVLEAKIQGHSALDWAQASGLDEPVAAFKKAIADHKADVQRSNLSEGTTSHQ